MSDKTMIAELKARLEAMEQREDSRLQPTGNPIRDGLTALKDHLAVHVNAHPNTDMSDLVNRADEVDENLSVKESEAFKNALNRFVSKNGTVAHDLAYVVDLAEDVHQAVLDKDAKASPVDPAPVPEATPDEKPDDEDDDEK